MDAEAEAIYRSEKRSMLIMRVERNRLKGRKGKIKKDSIQDYKVLLRYKVRSVSQEVRLAFSLYV